MFENTEVEQRLIEAAVAGELLNASGNQSEHCTIAANTRPGQLLYLSNLVLRALGWAFATLFVAGYTGLVRKANQISPLRTPG
ncbi:hypothetical protein [Saccharopolyspora sp. NPDC002376]